MLESSVADVSKLHAPSLFWKKMGSNTEFGGSWDSNFMGIKLTI